MGEREAVECTLRVVNVLSLPFAIAVILFVSGMDEVFLCGHSFVLATKMCSTTDQRRNTPTQLFRNA